TLERPGHRRHAPRRRRLSDRVAGGAREETRPAGHPGMSLRLLRAADRVAIPWKNGGGITHDVALSGAGPDDFAWRVSIADIERPGPFSSYPGIDRSFVPVHGKVRLTRGDGPVTLRP